MKHKGFTLIELLVVVAVVAILIGLVVPAVKHAVDKADLNKSLSNLRQIHKYAVLYATENRGRLPFAGYTAGDGRQNWYLNLKKLDEEVFPYPVPPGTPPGIRLCPLSMKCRPSSSSLDRVSTYSMNYWVSIGKEPSDSRNLVTVERPADTILFSTARVDSSGPKLNFGRPLTESGFPEAVYPPRRLPDKMSGNVWQVTDALNDKLVAPAVFVDGHAEPVLLKNMPKDINDPFWGRLFKGN